MTRLIVAPQLCLEICALNLHGKNLIVLTPEAYSSILLSHEWYNGYRGSEKILTDKKSKILRFLWGSGFRHANAMGWQILNAVQRTAREPL